MSFLHCWAISSILSKHTCQLTVHASILVGLTWGEGRFRPIVQGLAVLTYVASVHLLREKTSLLHLQFIHSLLARSCIRFFLSLTSSSTLVLLLLSIIKGALIAYRQHRWLNTWDCDLMRVFASHFSWSIELVLNSELIHLVLNFLPCVNIAIVMLTRCDWTSLLLLLRLYSL